MISGSLGELTFFRGRVALYAILKALEIGVGDEVATQAFTCVAVPEAIMATGARPVYVDLESNGFNMDADDLEGKITSRTRAIVVQHTYGIPADMERIISVTERADLPLIEDCCHTLASTYKGRTVGSFGVASFYSFEWGKPIVVGIGGSAVVNDPKLRDKVRRQYRTYQFPGVLNQSRIQLQYLAFRLLFKPSLYWRIRGLFRWLGSIGVAESNYNPIDEDSVAEDFSLRMPKSLQRRLARKLTILDRQTAHSRWAANEYWTRIQSEVVAHPVLPDDSSTVFARYPLVTQHKEGLLRKARQVNVELADWYNTPIHPLSKEELPSVRYVIGSCPNAEARCRQAVTLPTHSAVKKRDIDRAIEFLNEVAL